VFKRSSLHQPDRAKTGGADIENYLNFVLTMFLAFGLTFETPIVVVMLTRMGLVTIEQFREAFFIVTWSSPRW
jgi:sec-independent protein translocase protein TatC